jgi:hypothetical protein
MGIGMALFEETVCAVYHATGVRVRELPIRVERLLSAHLGSTPNS